MSSQAADQSNSHLFRPTILRQKSQMSHALPTSIKSTLLEQGTPNIRLSVVYLGIAITENREKPGEYIVGITAHDGTYSIDYTTESFSPTRASNLEESVSSSSTTSGVNTPATGASLTSLDLHASSDLANFILDLVDVYRKEHYYKVVGAGVTKRAAELCPELPSLLWCKLDIVCFVLTPFSDEGDYEPTSDMEPQVDEESGSVARMTIEKYGPSNLPRLVVKRRNEVGVDANGKAHMTRLQDYQDSTHANTWKATMHFAESLRNDKTKIAFFNTTPQGGGVALMRHALIRFLRLLGVNCKWYVPRPKGEVFRITKNNHNILQGVDEKGELTYEHIITLDEWCEQNAARYWTMDKGPLAHRNKGGADVIVVDDPQMPKLVEIAKQNDPDRPVIFRSHIQVRADRADDPATNTARVWDWVWNRVQKCDVFISHPVPDFVPKNVTSEKVGYMPATTDWLDGLNKPLDDWDNQYYMHEFRMDIRSHGGDFDFQYPDRPYIVQIARFDPAKGIPDVLASYAYLRRKYMRDWNPDLIPQLVIAGHGAIDDPDAKPIYDATMESIRGLYSDLKQDIIVMRVGPTDQILNVLMRNADVALQLSTREGFEVKVSEALHASIPIIAANRGGIWLQVHPERSGYLINRDEEDRNTGRIVPRNAEDVAQEVAKHLFSFFANVDKRESFAQYAKTHVSDEVSTVGNALCWLYLADTLAKGEPVVPERQWINDMARIRAREEGVQLDDSKEEKLPRTAYLPLSQ